MSSVNLRHYQHLTVRELELLPADLERLWIGPSFQTSVRVLVSSLPQRLVKLDLDLTLWNEEEDDDDSSSWTLPPSVQALSLRLPTRNDGTKRLLSQLDHHSSKNLTSLDLRNNHITEQELATIAASFHTLSDLNLSWNHLASLDSLTQPCLQRLDLSCNDALTDAACCAFLDGMPASLRELVLFGCTGISNQTALHLIDMLMCGKNVTLEKVVLHGTTVSNDLKRQVEYYLRLNRGGRRYLKTLELPLWPHLLMANRKDADVLYYFVRNKFDLVA